MATGTRKQLRSRLALGLAAGLLLGLGLLWPFLRSPPPRPLRNVLLITVDTLRADAPSFMGGKSRTPNMDALAAGSAWFSFAHAHSVVTLPSHANILTGLLPYQHGVRDNSGFSLAPSIPTLATLLHAQGFRTGAFIAAAPLDARFGLNRGFDVYNEGYAESRPGQAIFAERPGPAVVDSALGWLRSAPPDARWLAWVHIFEPHAPYAPPEPFKSRFPGAPYLGEVATADAALAPLLQFAASNPGTLVVLTADHGESLGEHGELTHGLFCYEPTLHVPLILHAPGWLEPGRHDEPARHIDLLPTLLEALGVQEQPPDLLGRSLAHPAARDTDLYFESIGPTLTRGWAPLRGMMSGREKWIELPIPELYRLASDPNEATNLAPQTPQSPLRQRLLERIEEDRIQAGGGMDPELQQKLESLGYLTTHEPVKDRYTEADDPKTLVGIDARLQEAIGQFQQGNLDEAIRIYRDVLRQRPTLESGYQYLASFHAFKGETAQAIATLREAMKHGLHGLDTRILLATYLTEAGQASEAVQLLREEATRKTPDVEALNVLGMALSESGEAPAALDCFRRILELDPGNARALLNLAVVALRQGDEPAARKRLDEALAQDPSMAEAWNLLGVIEARSGQQTQAVEHWKKAIELDPRQFNTLYNLGLLLGRLDRMPEALPYLERFVRTAPDSLASDRARIQKLLDSLAH